MERVESSPNRIFMEQHVNNIIYKNKTNLDQKCCECHPCEDRWLLRTPADH